MTCKCRCGEPSINNWDRICGGCKAYQQIIQLPDADERLRILNHAKHQQFQRAFKDSHRVILKVAQEIRASLEIGLTEFRLIDDIMCLEMHELVIERVADWISKYPGYELFDDEDGYYIRINDEVDAQEDVGADNSDLVT